MKFIRQMIGAVLRAGPIPEHIAFIMDGNRRWADRIKASDRAAGHSKGFEKLLAALEWCLELGVGCVSCYAFSIDNFKRSPEEVETLMALAEQKLNEFLQENSLIQEHQVQVRVIGNLTLLPVSVQAAAARVMDFTKTYSRFILNICLAYTSRQEIAQAVGKVQKAVRDRLVHPEDVNADLLWQHLYTQGCPPVDLLIRTSGESRLSDFLLWQSSHAQLSFTPVLWPAFSFLDLLRALVKFQVAYPHQQRIRLQGQSADDSPAALQNGDAHPSADRAIEQHDSPSAGEAGSPTEVGTGSGEAAPLGIPSRRDYNWPASAMLSTAGGDWLEQGMLIRTRTAEDPDPGSEYETLLPEMNIPWPAQQPSNLHHVPTSAAQEKGPEGGLAGSWSPLDNGPSRGQRSAPPTSNASLLAIPRRRAGQQQRPSMSADVDQMFQPSGSNGNSNHLLGQSKPATPSEPERSTSAARAESSRRAAELRSAGFAGCYDSMDDEDSDHYNGCPCCLVRTLPMHRVCTSPTPAVAAMRRRA